MGAKIINMMEGVSPKSAWEWAIGSYSVVIESRLDSAERNAAFSEDPDVAESVSEDVAAARRVLKSFKEEMMRLVDAAFAEDEKE